MHVLLPMAHDHRLWLELHFSLVFMSVRVRHVSETRGGLFRSHKCLNMHIGMALKNWKRVTCLKPHACIADNAQGHAFGRTVTINYVFGN